MIEPKYTPGPWRWTAVEGGWDGVEQENGPLICKLVMNEPENARLIAAAPELLEVCIEQHRALDLLMARVIALDSSFMPTKSQIWPTITKASAVITKATQGVA